MTDTIFQLPELDNDLASILGRPNFLCNHLATALRLNGVDIPNKSELEQANVIRFLLNCYLEDKDNWEALAKKKLTENIIVSNERIAFSTVHHFGTACALITVLVHKREGKDEYDPFRIKAIFKKPHVLEEGIFFTTDADATNTILRVMNGGNVFDRSLPTVKSMTYQEFIDMLDAPKPVTEDEPDGSTTDPVGE